MRDLIIYNYFLALDIILYRKKIYPKIYLPKPTKINKRIQKLRHYEFRLFYLSGVYLSFHTSSLILRLAAEGCNPSIEKPDDGFGRNETPFQFIGPWLTGQKYAQFRILIKIK